MLITKAAVDDACQFGHALVVAMAHSPFRSSNDAQNVPSKPTKAHSSPIGNPGIWQVSGESKFEQSNVLKLSNLVLSPKKRGKLSARCLVSHCPSTGKACLCAFRARGYYIRIPSARIWPKRKPSTPKAFQLAEVKSPSLHAVTRSTPIKHSCLLSMTDALARVIEDRSIAFEMPLIKRMLKKDGNMNI